MNQLVSETKLVNTDAPGTTVITGEKFEFEMNEDIGVFNYVSEAVTATGFLDDPHVQITIDSYHFIPNEDLFIKISREDFDELAQYFKVMDAA